MLYSKEELEMAKKNGIIDEIRGEMIDDLIGEKYSKSAELALLRKKDKKPEEFAAYNAYAEECIARVDDYLAKAEVYGK